MNAGDIDTSWLLIYLTILGAFYLLYVKKQFDSLHVSVSCMLFVKGADDDATTCAFTRGVAKLTEES
jgi:hypothetical protein